jgi:type II secretory pathway component GspD/PulD (secretin)
MRHGKLSAAACATVLCMVGLAFTAGWTAAATLTGMSVSTEGEVTRIHVTLDEPVEFSHFTLTDPARLFVDCQGVSQVDLENMPGGEGLAGEIEASVWKGDAEHALTRLAINLQRPSASEVRQVDDGLMITLRPQVEGDYTLGQSAEGEVVAEPQPSPQVETLTPAEEAFEYTLPTKPSYVKDYTRDEPSVASFGVEEEVGLSGRGGARVSMDIQGADIYTVLRSISEYSGVNIVMGYDVRSELKNPLSFHLESVPWGEALEMVLRSAHLWYREENGIIRVDTEENLRKEDLDRTSAARQIEEVMPLTTRIVGVVYANAGELMPAVGKALSKRGMIEVDDRTNSIVVTDIPRRVEAAVEMIQHLDSQTPQVEIVAKLVDVDARFSRELGILWSVGGLHSGAATGEADLGSNSVINGTANARFGMVKSWGTVNTFLSALEQENKANIISNPRITTVNNREARILVGKKIPLIVLDEAGNPVTELTTIGISLRVTPHINDNNRITLDLHPEVSDLSSQATVQGGVIINTSEADARVMVENGETAVIGGLIRANTSTVERGVPVLMDIPLIGRLFKGTSEVKEKRELLIFVTPRIITSFAAAD